MDQQFNRQQQEEARVGRRAAPIKKARITAVTAGTAQTIYTVPAKRAFELKSLMISNITAANIVFSIHAVAPSGSATDDNAEIKSAVIKANASDDLAPFISKFYEAGYTLRVFCNTTNAVVMGGWGEEVF